MTNSSNSDAPTGAARLEVRGLTKRFPGVAALDNVSLALRPGEVLAVIGENGAGKSTLMKILAGVQTADAGSILFEGSEVRIDSVRAATALGLALIHQELNLADNLDVASNIFLGREPRRWGFVNRSKLRRDAQELLDRLGLRFSPVALVRDLPIGHQQMIEIAKALSIRARVLIMDEPTSSLSQRETEQLYRVIRDLRDAEVSIVYISHRLGEVTALADRVVVLRDGKNAGELQRNEINHDAMVRLMVGRDVPNAREGRAPARPGARNQPDITMQTKDAEDRVPPGLSINGLRTNRYPRHSVSFEVRAGEIVGMAGLVGAGRSEILETVFGVRPAIGGAIAVDGRTVILRHPKDAIRAGIALVPEDRKRQSLVLEMMLRENVSLASVHRDSRGGLLNRRAERRLSGEMMDRLDIRAPNERQIVQLLSGGNQQKVVLGKWLALRPRVLLMDEPTRGIDVGAKREIYKLMEQLAAEGVAILFVSSEMEEILTMSERVLVVHEGAIAGELSREQMTEESIMQLATGKTRAAGKTWATGHA